MPDAIKDNRCCRCLEGTGIKDYFTIWSLSFRPKRSPPLSLSSMETGPSGGSFSSSVAVLGMECLTESEYCLIWESDTSLRFLGAWCPHNLERGGGCLYWWLGLLLMSRSFHCTALEKHKAALLNYTALYKEKVRGACLYHFYVVAKVF